MNEYVIETKGLTKSYGSFPALDHVDGVHNPGLVLNRIMWISM